MLAVSGTALAIALKSPSHTRDWQDEHAVLPSARTDGALVTLENVRNFSYDQAGKPRQARYDDRRYDISTLTSLWYGISHFSGFGLAHTFLSFGFEDGRYLAISIEARLEAGETYRPLSGLLRSYELIYVAGEERDIIGLRSHVRSERVYLYRVRVGQEEIRQMFLNMMQRINEIGARPAFYNTLTDNCTTSILRYAEGLSFFDRWLNYKVLLPGHSDELAYELGFVSKDLPFAALRARARIDPKATTIDEPDFSSKIRAP